VTNLVKTSQSFAKN